jgi:hypothetical protein
MTPRHPIAARRQRRSFRLACEELEPRLVLTGGVTPPTDLQDPVVAAVAQAEFVQDGGLLNRNDVINLLGVVDGKLTATFANGQVSFTEQSPDPNATLTASQLTDLQTLVKDAAAWGLTPDVANLAGKVVGYSLANEFYQGAGLLPNGQLTAGANDVYLRDLVNKWFKGGDLPSTIIGTGSSLHPLGTTGHSLPQGASFVSSNGLPDTVVYRTAQGVLFGANGPSPTDIAQGWVGDCYFMSALGETARQSPQTIQHMFIDNHDGTYKLDGTPNYDGTYAVRFFRYDPTAGTWNPDYVTVNLQLPTFSGDGQFAFAGYYQGGAPTTDQTTTAVLWPALEEKAYAQLAEEGWSRVQGVGGSGNSQTPNDLIKNSYDMLQNGTFGAIGQIVGRLARSDVTLSTATTADETALANAFNNGRLVNFASLSKEPSDVPINATTGAPKVVANHVYALVAADAVNDKFTLVNPYDDSSLYPADGQRTITLSFAKLQEWFSDYVIVPPPAAGT